MNQFKKLALVVAVALLAASGARAAEEDTAFVLQNTTGGTGGVSTVNYFIDSLGQDWNDVAAGPRVAGDSFVDDFIVEVNDPQDLVSFYVQANTVTSGRIPVPGVTFTSFVLTDLTGAIVFDPTDSYGSPNFISADWFLNSGTYNLEFTGTINGDDGGYTGPMSLTPVPEPTGLALMMAGLAAMGALARRRKNLG